MRALYDLPAPAKINWFLHVTGKRPDGYHTLQTVFQFIDWCDSLDLVRRDDGVIRRIGADDLPQDDLCVRAARLLQQHTLCTSGVDIHLRKSIPQQAGLGGGSSDAATVLIGLNRLWRLDLPRATLMQLALQLGADVPIFVFGRNAWAEGVGEDLQEISLPTLDFAVVHPARGLSTAAVFAALDLTTPRPEAKIAGFAEWLKCMRRPDGDSCSVGTGLHCETSTNKGSNERENVRTNELWGRNDLQSGAIALEPEVARAMQVLGAELARQQLSPRFAMRMTGSGSAVFAVVDASALKGNASMSSAVLASLPAGWSGRLCHGLREHPLRGWIQA